MPQNNEIEVLLENNRRWVTEVTREDPDFFARTASQQAPKYLWIGCSDSRVIPNQITGLPPGQLLVHRNIANVVMETDPNCMSVIDFAVRILEVRHIIVCGHYGCAGVHTAMSGTTMDPLNEWLDGIRTLWGHHEEDLLEDGTQAAQDRMTELNVGKQMLSLCRTPSVEDAWLNRKSLRVHGWIYGLKDGVLQNLYPDIGSISERTRAESESPSF
ncbi:MAG: carbonic anhydrase [Pseudomonadales bacterium]|nr:carbonic anhydrase [Pseudomonadales bacterium]